jgi:CheY-like chemotaxis protein
MTSKYRVAFLGFSEFERSALGSYFRLANREPHYVQVQTLTDADFLVADADHAPSMQLVAATDRMAETVFIGSQAPAGAVAWMSRPIDALHVMRELDAMVTVQRGGDSGHGTLGSRAGQPGRPTVSVVATTPWRSPTTFMDTKPRAQDMADDQPLSLPEDLGQRASWADELGFGAHVAAPPRSWEPSESLLERSASESLGPVPMWRRKAISRAAAAPVETTEGVFTRAGTLPAPQRPSPPSPPLPPSPRPQPSPPSPPSPPRALIVDDSPIAQRYLEIRLLRWGLVVDRAETSAAAQQLMLRHSYDLVFLDIELGPASELDGLALCRQIKQSVAAVNVTVVMVSAHHSELDRVRGALAGCDAYLGKPLDQAELDELLLRQGLSSPTVVRKKYKRATAAS